ncbi:MAG: enolase C-terminal domain-like protein, partial [Mycobacteriales bacterium]
IEQPLAWDDLWEHARLQEKIKTPICLDESITSIERAAQAIEIGACRWINVKLGRVGGTTPAREIIAHAARVGIPCWIGGMLESAIGASHSLALATLPNICYPSDIFSSSRFYAEDLGQPEIELSTESTIAALDKPGIGCTPDARRLAARTIESCQLERQ